LRGVWAKGMVAIPDRLERTRQGLLEWRTAPKMPPQFQGDRGGEAGASKEWSTRFFQPLFRLASRRNEDTGGGDTTAPYLAR